MVDGNDKQCPDRNSPLTDVLDTSDVGAFVLDSDFDVVWVNQAVEEYFGLDRDAVLGADKRKLVTEEIQDRFTHPEGFADRVLATYDQNDYIENFECHIRNTEVTDERWLEHWSQPIETGPYAGGRIEHYTDVSGRKYREQQLQRRRRELEHQTERLENFVSTLSHDLRTPCTLPGPIGVLCENDNAEDAVITEIEQALDRADSIIDDVLTLARDNTTITDSKPVDIAAVVEDAWENVRTQTATLEIEDECIVTADPSQVTRLFENLFRNAVEHGSTSPRSQTHEDAVEHGSTSSQPKADNAVERGNGDVDVRVGRLADAGFYVADDGPGIPPEEREKVFEWAYSLGGHGTGFGLAIVRQIAEAHGWAIAVTESESGGARFEFRGVDIGNTSA